VDVCITSAAKGGTGKTTFAEILAYVWRKAFGISAGVAKPFSRGDFEAQIVDFPAFQLTDKLYIKRLIECDGVVYVVDEDPETLNAVETLHVALRDKVFGVVLNKVVKKPGKEFLRAYGRLGKVYVVHFDERMAVHRSIGVPPYRVRSIATLEMAKAAVGLKRFVSSGPAGLRGL
jgi:MinD-like ATPase involved in chromosome partitioning or flagellar assembly